MKNRDFIKILSELSKIPLEGNRKQMRALTKKIADRSLYQRQDTYYHNCIALFIKIFSDPALHQIKGIKHLQGHLLWEISINSIPTTNAEKHNILKAIIDHYQDHDKIGMYLFIGDFIAYFYDRSTVLKAIKKILPKSTPAGFEGIYMALDILRIQNSDDPNFIKEVFRCIEIALQIESELHQKRASK